MLSVAYAVGGRRPIEPRMPAAQLRARPHREGDEEPEAEQLDVGAGPDRVPGRSGVALVICALLLVAVANSRPPAAPMATPASMTTTEATPQAAKTRSCVRSFMVCSFDR